jgi:hypothetical protein
MNRDPDTHELFMAVVTAVLISAIGLAVATRMVQPVGLQAFVWAKGR